MKNVLSLILCVLMLASCLVIGIYAEEETTAAAAEDTSAAPEVVYSPTHIIFDANLTGKKNPVSSYNELSKGGISKTGEWQGYKIVVAGNVDPHIGINYANYLNKTGNEPWNIENMPFIVIKIMADEICFDDFEIYYCAGEVVTPSEECRKESDYAHDNGSGGYFFVFDLTDLASGELHSLRIDLLGAEIDSVMYMTDIVFFKTEDEALNWCGYYDEQPEGTTEGTTEEITTEEITTEEETEPTTKKPATEAETKAEEGGCGSVIGTGFAAIALIALGAVCFKKKD